MKEFEFETVLNYILRYNLQPQFQWLIKHNRSQALPYHNLTHCMRVAYHAIKAWQYANTGKEVPEALVVAALFHDCWHSGGFYPNDRDNILKAILALSDCEWTLIKNGLFCPVINDESSWYDVKMMASQMIAATEFPKPSIDEWIITKAEYEAYEFDEDSITLSYDEYSLCIDCLLDADFTVSDEFTVINNIIGIKQELFKYEAWDHYLQHTIDFYTNLSKKYRTKYGKELGRHWMDDNINMIKAWLNVLEWKPEPRLVQKEFNFDGEESSEESREK